MGSSISCAASVQRLSLILARLITTGDIASMEHHFRLKDRRGVNKAERIEFLLLDLLAARRKRDTETAVHSAVMIGHRRALASKITMGHADVDAVIAELRHLEPDATDLVKKGWRTGLTASPRPEPAPPMRPATGGGPAVAEVFRPRPVEHVEARRHLQTLSHPDANPQQRGSDLELILLSVLQVERLHPSRRVRNLGEEIDLTFVLDSQHYHVECKWEQKPCGSDVVRAFMAKVQRKAEGTFGVMLCMTGYVRDINETAVTGTRLNCVGVSWLHLTAVVEGRTTWTDVVRAARRQASDRSLFQTELES